MHSVPNFKPKHMIASCPNCRGNQLYSMQTQKPGSGFSSKEEVLVCKSCRLSIMVKDLKKLLLSV